MLSESEKQDKDNPKDKIPSHSRQLIVNWAWANIKIRKEAIAKSFLVTGAFGTWEEKLVRNDELRK